MIQIRRMEDPAIIVAQLSQQLTLGDMRRYQTAMDCHLVCEEVFGSIIVAVGCTGDSPAFEEHCHWLLSRQSALSTYCLGIAFIISPHEMQQPDVIECLQFISGVAGCSCAAFLTVESATGWLKKHPSCPLR